MARDDGKRVEFFLSYAEPDKDWAVWIAAQLVDAGYTVELDIWDWVAGRNVFIAHERAVAAAHRMIVLLSPDFFHRAWRTVERHAARAAQTPDSSDGFLVPVVVKPCVGPKPDLISDLLDIDLVGLGEPQARAALLRGISPTRPPLPASSVPFPATAPAAPGSAAFPGRLPRVRNLPARNPLFTGRADILDEIASQLVSPRPAGEPAVVVLTGAGGCGKTELALEFAWRHAADYRVTWWVDASSLEAVETAFVELAVALELSPTRGLERPHGLEQRRGLEQRSQVLGELDRRGSWLVLFDNVETDNLETTDIVESLPGNGHVVACARGAGHIDAGRRTLPVRPFTRAESVSLLRIRGCEMSDIDADRVAHAARDHPLSVALAGAYLATTAATATSYLASLTTVAATAPFSGDPDAAAGQGPHPSGGAGTAAAAMLAALRRLADDEPVALDFLRQLSFFAPAPVPLAAAATANTPSTGGLVVGDPDTTAQLVRAVSELDIGRMSGTFLHVHPGMQKIVREGIPASRRKKVLVRALDLLGSADPGDPAVPAQWPGYAALARHVDTVTTRIDAAGVSEPASFRRLVLAICSYRYASGQYRLAHSLASRSLERWRLTLDDDRADTVAAANILAAVLFALGDVSDSLDLFQELLARRRRVLGDDHPDTLASANNLANVLYNVKRLRDARELWEDTLKRRRRVLGNNHPDTLVSTNNLAAALSALGDAESSFALHEDTFKRRRRELGEDHPATLHSAHNMTVAMVKLKRYEDARTAAEDTFARRRRILSDDHPDTLSSAHVLGETFFGLGLRSQARCLWEDTLARQRQTLGDDHQDTRRSAARLRKL